jgi:hypothetical protein
MHLTRAKNKKWKPETTQKKTACPDRLNRGRNLKSQMSKKI